MVYSVSVLILIEAVWNIFPPRPETSALLLVLHVVVLLANWVGPGLVPPTEAAGVGGGGGKGRPMPKKQR